MLNEVENLISSRRQGNVLKMFRCIVECLFKRKRLLTLIHLKINIQFGFSRPKSQPEVSLRSSAIIHLNLETMSWVHFWQFCTLIVLSTQQLAQKAFQANPIICSQQNINKRIKAEVN